MQDREPEEKRDAAVVYLTQYLYEIQAVRGEEGGGRNHVTVSLPKPLSDTHWIKLDGKSKGRDICPAQNSKL